MKEIGIPVGKVHSLMCPLLYDDDHDHEEEGEEKEDKEDKEELQNSWHCDCFFK